MSTKTRQMNTYKKRNPRILLYDETFAAVHAGVRGGLVGYLRAY